MGEQKAIAKLLIVERRVAMEVAQQEHDSDITHAEAIIKLRDAIFELFFSDMACLDALIVEHCHLFILSALRTLEEREK